jgi:uncharacterized protein YdeI (BOF family)
VLKSPVAIRALAPSEAETSRPVKLTATVVSKMRDEDVYFVHDGAGGLLIHDVGNQAGLVVSNQVEIVGHTVSEADVHVVVDEIRVVEQRVPLPPAIAFSQPELLVPDNVHRWTELRGTVRSFTQSRTQVRLQLNTPAGVIHVSMRRPPRSVLTDYRYATLRLRAISMPPRSSEPRANVWVDHWSKVVEERAVQVDLFSVRPGSIDRLAPRAEPVAVWGRVVEPVGEDSFRIRDASGEVLVERKHGGRIRVGDRAKVFGFVDRVGDSVKLANVSLQVVAGTRSDESVEGEKIESVPWDLLSPVIDRASRVVALSREESARGFPVRVPGIVTFIDADEHTIYVKGRTRSIRVVASDPAQPSTGLQLGDRLVVSGFTAAGGFGPIVSHATFDSVEPGAVPEPRVATTTSLIVGRHESEWIVMDGVVHKQRIDDYRWLTIVRADRPMSARFDREVVLPENLVGARVRIRGIARAMLNRLGQTVGTAIHMSGSEDLEVIDPIPLRPFEKPSVRIGDLMRFRSEASYTTRNRVLGTVTLTWPDRIFIQDESGSLEVRTAAAGTVKRGDLVNVLGFPHADPIKPRLENAMLQLVGHSAPPVAVAVAAGQVLSGQFNDKRIRVDGTLGAVLERHDMWTLILRSGVTTFSVLPAQAANERLR